MKVQVRVIQAYGKLLVYPSNDAALGLCKLIRRDTFTRADILSALDQGYKIEVVPTFTLDEVLKSKQLK